MRTGSSQPRPSCPPSRGHPAPTPSAFVSAVLTKESNNTATVSNSKIPATPTNTTTSNSGSSSQATAQAQSPVVDRRAVGGALGLLRSRDTGNSPSRERLATPLSSSYKGPSTTSSSLTTNNTGNANRVEAGNNGLFPVFPPPRTAVFGAAGRRAMLRGLAHTSVDGAFAAASSLTNAPVGLGAQQQPLLPPLFVPPMASREADENAPLLPPAPRAAITVVFDLDETLCNNRRPGKALLRPHTLELLHHLHALRNDPHLHCYIELVLWTASMECVARPVVDRIDPTGTLFQHCIYRDRRWYKEQGYTKDLRRLGRDMNHTVIIENSPASVRLNRGNSILVKDFVSGQDSDLLVVRDILDAYARRCGETSRVLPPPQQQGASSTSKEEHHHPHHPHVVSGSNSSSSSPAVDPSSIVGFLGERPELNHGNEIVARPPPSYVAKLQQQQQQQGGGATATNKEATTTAGAVASPPPRVGISRIAGAFRSSYAIGSR